jgi:hypothetical protein
MERHAQELSLAQVSVVVASWWGRPGRVQSTDWQGVETNSALAELLKYAETSECLRVAVHLEPYKGADVCVGKQL